MARTKLDLNLLPVACVLFEQRSVSRAAEKLGMSQPAVSRALKRMRDTLGDPLFVKSRQGVEPTAKALALVSCARDVLARVQAGLFASPVFNPASYDGVFSVSLAEAGEGWLWPQIFFRLRRLAPRATYRLVRLPTQAMRRELESGGIDLAIGLFPKLHANNLFRQGLLRLRPVCLIRSDHPIRAKKLTIKQFLRLEHIMVNAIGQDLLVDHVLAQHKIQRKIVLTIGGYTALLPIIANSDLIVTLSSGFGRQLAANSPGVRVVEAPLALPTPLVAQYWHRKYNNDLRNKWLRSQVKEALESLTETGP